MALIEDIWRHVSAKGLFIFFGVSFVLWRILVSVDQRMRLNRLPGGRATSVKATLPFGKSGASPKKTRARDMARGLWKVLSPPS